jgi:curved DNA-binding protein CbpA
MADLLENQYDNDKFIDFYKILDIDNDASIDDIKKNYISLAKKYHPDQKNGNTEMFQLVSKAYEVLSNKETRKDYDLYYLKKSFSELNEPLEDTFFSMKDQFNDFVIMNDKKKISKEDLDKLYDDVFKDREDFIEQRLDHINTNKRINDINLEREIMNIESTDEQLKNIVTVHPELDVGEVLEYIKESNKNTNTEIINNEFGTLDTLPGYFDTNYSSFIDDSENMPNSFFTMIDNNSMGSSEQVKNFNMDNFNEWKNTKKANTKLESKDIDLYLSMRRQEEQELLQEVETNLKSNIKKRTDIEVFLKPKDKSIGHINEEDLIKVETVNNVKRRTF